MPPSTASSAPVMNEDSSEAKNSAACATSSAVPKRRQRRLLQQRFGERRHAQHALGQRRLDEARRQRIHADAERCVLNRKTARQRRDGALGGPVGRERAHAAMAHDGSKVHERGATRRLHQREGVTRDAYDAVEVHLAQAYPVGVRHVAKIGAHVDAGVVDDDIEAAVLAARRAASAPSRPGRARHRPSPRSPQCPFAVTSAATLAAPSPSTSVM